MKFHVKTDRKTIYYKGKIIAFKSGTFETDNEAQIEFLSDHPQVTGGPRKSKVENKAIGMDTPSPVIQPEGPWMEAESPELDNSDESDDS